jgi:hypothetical protein
VKVYKILFLALNFCFCTTIAQVPCGKNKFFGASAAGTSEYVLEGNTVTYIGIAENTVNYNLAICNNLNGGAFNPTYYGADGGNVYYFDGVNWNNTNDSISGYDIVNPGGNGEYLYYLLYPDHEVVSRGVAKYDTSGLHQILSMDTSRRINAADIVVDSIGNFYLFTGDYTGDYVYITDTILYVSPTGQILKKYPFAMNTMNAYGAFMFDNIIYLGLGDQNPLYSNKLFPIIIGNDTAIAGQPIDMSTDLWVMDLASCGIYKNYTPSSIPDITISSGIELYPNPASNEVSISWNNSEPVNLRVFDMAGKLIVESNKVNSGYILSTQNMADGLYLLQIISGNNISTKKLIVQH